MPAFEALMETFFHFCGGSSPQRSSQEYTTDHWVEHRFIYYISIFVHFNRNAELSWVQYALIFI